MHERVIATMLLQPGKVLPVSRLVEAVWAEDPPATASHQVRKAVADLRRRIPGGSALIVTEGPGYAVVLADGQSDLNDFNELLRRSREHTAEGRPAEAAEALRAALALWRGPVLSGAGGAVVEAAATVLEETRLAAAEQLFDLRLALGESVELVVELRGLMAEHPLRETLRAQLMLALYRSGRQAEALQEYARARELLVEELGIDPGAQLTRMYEDILRANPELGGPESAIPAALPAQPAAPPPPAPVPCTLPHGLPDFTGRERELRKVLEAAGRESRGPRIIAIDGMGGAGKTALAVHAAHQLSGEYPDGQIFLDLRGFSPDQEPLRPWAALDVLLRLLGVPAEEIPTDGPGRIALWRARLTGRVLLLFDNAGDAGQVLPLLPPSPDCLVLVTSRARLVDLDGARWVSLGLLPPEESDAMIREVLGTERVEREPEAAEELAALCGHLPLALRLALARLRKRPSWSIWYLVERLQDETHLLDELSAGERSVAANLNLSYRALDEEQRTAFRLLAQHPGPEIDLHASAALLATAPRNAEDLLEDLLDKHLLQQHDSTRYAFHDLVRAFALSVGDGVTGPQELAAVRRMVGYYVAATDRACEVLFPHRGALLLAAPEPGPAAEPALPRLTDPERSLEWFDREIGCVLVLLERHADRCPPVHVFRLARNASFLLNLRTRTGEFVEVSTAAVAAARQIGDSHLVARGLANLGVAHWKLGRFEAGLPAAEEALSLAQQGEDPRDVPFVLGLLAVLHYALGNLAKALDYGNRAIALHQSLGSKRPQAEDWATVCSVLTALGLHQEAVEAARNAIELSQELGYSDNEVVAWTCLALALLGLGDVAGAREAVDRALALNDASKKPENHGLALAVSADLYHRLGLAERSREHERQALEQLGVRSTRQRAATAHNLLGLARLRGGEPQRALELHGAAYEHADGIGHRVETAHALDGLAAAYRELGRTAEAEAYAARAGELFAAMGLPEAGRRRP
ncbi:MULTISPECIES: BTAD domain-containing putative transcriptional regulator [Kitasatospora]|uniref:Putative AfsR family transcriptional regulator n=1 Tax=Kitasatospora setae (strain ATCC 33774 / DSM 43861 / JCM 3304 / KCC A-0304 / NBRC 14216 / KM-6054) TaxID=452652 RepID=E4N0J9_KITSK|nr:BTAD domain-containing putative transcriptional regulator [Kitasatospora setae]BAJ31683.1 putative AfsR family transcriptional regulator [Kitasatospora setae KM-6054]